MIPAPVHEASQVWLALHAFVLVHLGRPGEAQHSLALAATLASQAGPEPGLPELAAMRQAIAAGIARLECDLNAAQGCYQAVNQELAQLGQSRDGRTAAMASTAAANAVAGTLLWHGDLPAARQLLDRIERDTASHKLARMRVNCLGLIALLHATAGQLRQAQTLAADALSLARTAGLSDQFQASPALLAAALVALRRGDHAQARQRAADVADRARLHADLAPLVLCTRSARPVRRGTRRPARSIRAA